MGVPVSPVHQPLCSTLANLLTPSRRLIHPEALNPGSSILRPSICFHLLLERMRCKGKSQVILGMTSAKTLNVWEVSCVNHTRKCAMECEDLLARYAMLEMRVVCQVLGKDRTCERRSNTNEVENPESSALTWVTVPPGLWNKTQIVMSRTCDVGPMVAWSDLPNCTWLEYGAEYDAASGIVYIYRRTYSP